METFDVAVVGVGGIGSAALFHLAQRKLRVVGFEQYSVAHDRGSSHGQTRLIRQAYFEHADYVPLLLRSYELWRELEQLTQQHLLMQLGLIEIGPPDGIVLSGIRRAADQHSLHIEPLSASQTRRRFPMFRVPDGMESIFEPTAGLLFVEACVATYIKAAQSIGAQLHTASPVRRIAWDRSPIEVHTDDRIVLAERLVVCAGAWTAEVLELNLPLQVVRKHLYWFPNHHPHWQATAPCPTFFYELTDGYYYGFPAVDSSGVKIAEHSGGEPVQDPSRLDRTPDAVDHQRIVEFLQSQLIGVKPPRGHHAVCMYTKTPDDHFIVDLHPDNSNIAIVAGLSGHGFKFAPVLGEVLADLVTQGTTSRPVEFLALDRFPS